IKYKLMFLVPFVSMISSCSGYNAVSKNKESNTTKEIVNKPAVYYKGDTLVLVTSGAYHWYNNTLFSR
ncbi:MAG: hypothetical protein MJ158_03360, partial [Alphaproteobacteria bacterium]|nr:hypothetical protein [Alphaproteobacteria bacterium]